MRVLMFGRGVIATIYGHVLQAAGHDVEFYVRPGRAAEYGDGAHVDLIDARRKPWRQRVRATVPLHLRESMDAGDRFDLVVLSVGHHRLAEAASFLAPRIGDATVLVFGNVWKEPSAAVAPIPLDQVVFGFPLAGGGFADDGVLHGALLGSVILGRASASRTPREAAVAELFRRAGLSVREEADMRGWLLIHFAADAGMFAQGIHLGGIAGMVGNRRALKAALETSRELIPVLTSRAVDLGQHRSTLTPFRMPGMVAAAMALATALIPFARTNLAAHTDPYSAEARAILTDMHVEAHRLGIPVPRLDAALRDAPFTAARSS